MKDKNSISESDAQEALELLESIKKAHDQEQNLLADNAFVYYCLWLSFNNPQVLKRNSGRVKVYFHFLPQAIYCSLSDGPKERVCQT